MKYDYMNLLKPQQLNTLSMFLSALYVNPPVSFYTPHPEAQISIFNSDTFHGPIHSLLWHSNSTCSHLIMLLVHIQLTNFPFRPPTTNPSAIPLRI